ncbi:hypothetical protein HID58_094868 [Brassica napus]|uniref:Uncharacterized protein n=1 Tax=Brassica napus TaxID=3708 RepID=A0ABQ7X884_BRANA|nr:hypothetical protein HID58_094868 [Brassica napus]
MVARKGDGGWIARVFGQKLKSRGRHNLTEKDDGATHHLGKNLAWFIVEIALIGADIQEVSGSAIALQILTCAFLPIWPLDFISREVLMNEELEGLSAAFLFPDNLTSCWSCWMCNNSSQCVLAFGFSAVRKDNPKDINRVQEALNYNNVKSSAALFPLFHDNLFVTTLKAWDWEHYLQNKYGGESIPDTLHLGEFCWLLDKEYHNGDLRWTVYNGRFLDLLMEQWLSAFLTRSFASVPTIVGSSYVNTSEGLIDVLKMA